MEKYVTKGIITATRDYFDPNALIPHALLEKLPRKNIYPVFRSSD
jgi:hypothetical protein